ncbi:MAG: uroporphyrinogen decarboxylase family protein, partial [Thermoproteota archaeon]
RQPEKVLEACEALAPHLTQVARMTADPEKKVPIGFWMHRSAIPFISMEHFEKIHWRTLRPIIEELWSNGLRVLFYAEGDWTPHLDSFAELPEGSIIFHIDRSNIFESHRKLGHKFCLSGGLPNWLLTLGTPDEVHRYCKKIIDSIASEGGYIMDASAIIQNDAKVENVKAMTEFTRSYGKYEDRGSECPNNTQREEKAVKEKHVPGLKSLKVKPGVCIPWDEKRREIEAISGDEGLFRRVWEEIESLGYLFIWQVLLSF